MHFLDVAVEHARDWCSRSPFRVRRRPTPCEVANQQCEVCIACRGTGGHAAEEDVHVQAKVSDASQDTYWWPAAAAPRRGAARRPRPLHRRAPRTAVVGHDAALILVELMIPRHSLESETTTSEIEQLATDWFSVDLAGCNSKIVQCLLLGEFCAKLEPGTGIPESPESGNHASDIRIQVSFAAWNIAAVPSSDHSGN